MRIDVQCHVFPRKIEKYFFENDYPKCARMGEGFFCDFGYQKLLLPDSQYLPENILKSMDQGNVDISVISPNIPDPGFLKKEKGVDFCKEINEEVKTIVDNSDGRFYGIGLLPWTSPEDAVKEVDHVLDLGMKGVMLFSRNGDLQVDDPSLIPVYDKIETAGLPISIHPTVPMWGDAIGDYAMVASFSFIIDTAFAFIRLCNSGIMDKHPDMKVIMPHAGGVLPYLDGRMPHDLPPVGPDGKPRPRTVYEIMHSEQAWFDLANHSPFIMNYFKGYLGLDRAMYATDYPFADQKRVTDLQGTLEYTEEELEKINWKNANEVFQLGL